MGFIQGALTITRMLAFDKYPLAPYEESRCDYLDYPVMVEGEKEITAVDNNGESEAVFVSPKTTATANLECKLSIEDSRQVKKVEDIVKSISTLIVGLTLTLSFKRFIFG